MKNICLPIRYILEQSLLRSTEFYPLGMLCVGSLFRFPWRVQECDGNDYQQNFLGSDFLRYQMMTLRSHISTR